MLLANSEAAAWIEALRASTLAECAAQKRHVETAWREPLTARIASGRALGMLRIVRQQGKNILFELTSSDDNLCFLREGDFVRLSRNDPFQPAASLILAGEDHEGIHAEIWSGDAGGCRDGWTIDADYIDLSSRYLDALDALALSPRLLDSLMGRTEPEMDLDLDGQCRDDLEGGLFNPSQVDAVAACIAARDAFLVQGPPGTGKTRVLAEVAARLIDRGESLLVTGPTHRAIDHALSAIRDAIGNKARVAKIGFGTLGSRGDFERFDHYEKSGLADTTDPHVIGATPFALWAKSSGLYSVRFDTVLLDEASQILPIVASMAMLRGERWLFFGDDRQLPPVVLTRDGTPPRLRSVFGMLRDRDMEVMLDESYRLSGALASWPSATFYGNRLSGKHARQLHLGGEAPAPELQPSPALAIRRCPAPGCSVKNDAEAEAVRELIRHLIAGGIRPEEIGVVTPFRAQAGRIRQLLRLEFGAGPHTRSITVDTVERFQGQERDVMIVAMTASKPDFIERLADFLFQPERLNVAITRARLKTVLLVPEEMAGCAARLADAGHEGATTFCSLIETPHD
jgi:DNA replication ATP-dependent helicase Dna2